MKSAILLLAIIGAIGATPVLHKNLKRGDLPAGIINGVNASISDHNYLGTVHINRPDLTTLSGTAIILGTRWVLTSATSVYNQSVENLQVRVGSTNANDGGELLNVINSVIYTGYNLSSLKNNLALLELEKDLVFNEKVNSIELDGTTPELGTNAVVAGFGLTLDADDELRLRTINVTIEKIDDSNKWSTNDDLGLIYTKSNWVGGPTWLDWGSPLIVNNRIAGLFTGNDLPGNDYERNNSTVDAFISTTTPDVWQWILEVVVTNSNIKDL